MLLVLSAPLPYLGQNGLYNNGTGVEGSAVIPGNEGLYMMYITCTGLFAGATMPITLELLAEVSYPVSEGISGNVVALIMQVPAAILIAIVPIVRADVFNTIMGACFFGCALLVVPVKEVYARAAAARTSRAC